MNDPHDPELTTGTPSAPTDSLTAGFGPPASRPARPAGTRKARGSATGEAGFWARWQDYIRTGHGGNVALKSRDPSDYQVSILEVAGTAATVDDILKMESRWKAKLQSGEMGLNRN
jgi:hypothetical protein